MSIIAINIVVIAILIVSIVLALKNREKVNWVVLALIIIFTLVFLIWFNFRG